MKIESLDKRQVTEGILIFTAADGALGAEVGQLLWHCFLHLGQRNSRTRARIGTSLPFWHSHWDGVSH
eukprot:s2017_g2.t1